MSKKAKILLSTYIAAGLAVFSLWIWQSRKSLENYRMLAGYSYGRAFEETVNSVDGLSEALQKSLYATDSGMSGKVCAEIYAKSLAAETAMSTLPFSTQELEQISAFLNMTGDYAYTLNYKAAEDGFKDEEREILGEMSELAADFAEYMREIQSAVNSGAVSMDSREKDFRNVAIENDTEKLSARLLNYEKGFKPMPELVYDGKFGKAEKKPASGNMNQEEMAKAAADFAGVELSELKKEYDYEGTSGRSCFSAGDMHICVCPGGVESISNSRLVGDVNINKEEAEKRAEDFLQKHGYENLELMESSINGAVCNMCFSKNEGGAACLDNCVSISIAMDDGSLYDFNAMKFTQGDSEAEWKISEEQAAGALPKNLKPAGSRKVILKSPGGRDMACFEFACTDKNGNSVKVYVDAETGKQFDIEIEEQLR